MTTVKIDIDRRARPSVGITETVAVHVDRQHLGHNAIAAPAGSSLTRVDR
jgi:hypothetical protein